MSVKNIYKNESNSDLRLWAELLHNEAKMHTNSRVGWYKLAKKVGGRLVGALNRVEELENENARLKAVNEDLTPREELHEVAVALKNAQGRERAEEITAARPRNAEERELWRRCYAAVLANVNEVGPRKAVKARNAARRAVWEYQLECGRDDE